VDTLRIVLGLGNPGARYETTRHNLGFRVLDSLAQRKNGTFQPDPPIARLVSTARIEIAGHPLVLAKPRTYMNRSGRAALALCEMHEVDATEMLVVHDDADLELGRVRFRRSGGAGGHNGLRSLMDVLGTREFPRLKLGVRGAGRDDGDLADYVLTQFDPDEDEAVRALIELGADAVEAAAADGVERAMERFHTRRARVEDSEESEVE